MQAMAVVAEPIKGSRTTPPHWSEVHHEIARQVERESGAVVVLAVLADTDNVG